MPYFEGKKTRLHMRPLATSLCRSLLPVTGFFLLTVPVGAQNLAADPFTYHLVGTWVGAGSYDGDSLALTRRWELILNDEFLQGDMAVTMSNGVSFGALTFWKSSQAGGYQIIWMDGIGRMQTLRAMRDPTSGRVSSDFVDEFAEDGPETRRWEFEVTGANTYVERLYRQTGKDWVLLTEWSFERLKG